MRIEQLRKYSHEASPELRADLREHSSPQLFVIAAADQDNVGAAKAMLSKADHKLLSAIHHLAEDAGHKKLLDHFAKATMATLRKGLAGEHFPHVQDIAAAHVQNAMGGGFFSWLRHIGHKIGHIAKKVVMAPVKLGTKILEGGSKVVGHVAANLQPVVGEVAQLATAAAPLLKAAAPMGLPLPV